MAEKIAREAHIWERDKLDWYVEPTKATEQLLVEERFVGRVWDPCCGGGNIVGALLHAGLDAYGTDIVRRTEDRNLCVGERDFLAPGPTLVTNIVMNPPYFGGAGTEAFIRRAIEVARGKICVFVDRRFVTGKRRAAGLYTEHRPTRVWEITPRPSCPPGEYLAAGNKAGGGTADYCWMVWDMTAPPGRTDLGWLKG